MATNVVLHIGTPKTGTSMIQDLLARNATTLRKQQGVLVPGGAFDHQYRAGLDLLDAPSDDNAGAWDRVATEVRRHDGVAIISNELLTRAAPEQIQRAADALQPAELDVVISVRDLARQVASGWQEAVKHRATLSFEAFVQGLHADPPRRRVARGFWDVQDWSAAAERWAARCGAARVHLVTVPPAGTDPHVLRDRLLSAMGIDPAWVPIPAERLNTRLGAVETKVLRGINARNKPDALDAGQYAEFVRDRLVRELAERSVDPVRIALAPVEHQWVAGISERWVAAATAAGYNVVGDLADLTPQVDPQWHDPDDVAADAELDAAYSAIDALLAGQVAERDQNVDRFYEIARAYARQRIGRLRFVRGMVRALRLRR